MEEAPKRLLKQVRWLTQGLILSAAINVGLVTAIGYVYFRQTEPLETKSSSSKKVVLVEDHKGLVDTLTDFKERSYNDLIHYLEDEQLVEQGYRKRDLALSVLVAHHYFNLSTALKGEPIQYRQLVFQNEEKNISGEITLFPGLGDAQYNEILSFVKLERWPLTPQGLFLILKRSKELNRFNSSLAEAFYLTPEFTSVERLLHRKDKSLSKKDILSMILDGDWQMLSEYLQRQHLSMDLSDRKRQQLLLDYLVRESPNAAEFLVKMEKEFLIKDLDDERLLLVLPLLTSENNEDREFILELITSPRSDALWKEAARCLYRWEGQPLPEPYDHLEAINRFVPNELLDKKIKRNLKPVEHKLASSTVLPQKLEEPSVEKKINCQPMEADEGTYTVQNGDSLWKIANRFGVRLKDLRDLNSLEGSMIKAGQVLYLPKVLVLEEIDKGSVKE
jgi:hypothetical protein